MGRARVVRALGVVTAVAGACVALPAAAGGIQGPLSTASPALSAANSTTFQDSTGENPDAPDITSVVASNTDAGVVVFLVNIPNRPALTGDMLIDISVDSDNNPATGDPQTAGADYAFELFQGQVNLYRWDGTNFVRRAGDPPQASVTFSYARGATIRISTAELGNTTRFNFGTIAISGIVVDPNTGNADFSNARADAAPDPGHGLWSFQVRRSALRLLARRFSTDRPAAGRVFTARLVAARSDTGAVLSSGQVTCTATVAGRRLAVRTKRFVGREARCAWAIPSSAADQTIRGSVAVQFEGLRVRRSFAATVR